MFSGYSTYAQVYFCVRLCVQMEIWSHKVTSDLVVILGHYWKPCGPFANLNGIYSPWKIYGVHIQNLTDGLNVTDDPNENGGQNEIYLLDFHQK